MKCIDIILSNEETLENLATKYNTSVEEIIEANPNIDLNNLIPGQQICIPQDDISIVCPIGSIPYEVKSGDTLGNIASKFYTTVETIIETNPNLDPNNIQVGQVICITEKKPDVPSCPSLNIYVINLGDTIASIASKFGLSVQSLLDLNPTIDPYKLEINSVICLPLTPTPYIIVINVILKTLNLYYLGRFYKSYVVATGKPSTPTPKGNFYIHNKQVNPGGPYGTRWMGLSVPSYGIHGTNRPESIGTAASNGCIRMFNNDIEELFSKVSVNTPVIII